MTMTNSNSNDLKLNENLKQHLNISENSPPVKSKFLRLISISILISQKLLFCINKKLRPTY